MKQTDSTTPDSNVSKKLEVKKAMLHFKSQNKNNELLIKLQLN